MNKPVPFSRNFSYSDVTSEMKPVKDREKIVTRWLLVVFCFLAWLAAFYYFAG